MTRRRAWICSVVLAPVLLIAACQSDNTDETCSAGNGARACVTDDGAMTLEGFLPGSTATITLGAATTGATGGSGTGATAPTGLPVVIGSDGRQQGGIGLLSVVRTLPKQITVVGVSATNRPVNLTITRS